MDNNKRFSPNVNLWLETKNDIELKIITGEFEVGKRIPSIPQVADIYGVGNSTAQKVLESLYNEGIIVKQSGVGYFVKPYVREKLTNIHKDELKKRLFFIVEYGMKLGVEKNEMIDILISLYDNKYNY